MIVVCPCCRATNEAGPGCRRCKADLSLLFMAERHRDHLLTTARTRLHDDPAAAQTAAAAAERIRSGPDARRLLALACLLGRDFPAARTWYSASVTNTERRDGA